MKTISKYEAYAIKALRTMGVREDLAGFDYTVEAVRLVVLPSNKALTNADRMRTSTNQ